MLILVRLLLWRNETGKRDKLRLCRSDDEGRARLSQLRASSPKWLARVRTHSPLAPPCREGNVMVMLRCRRNESPRRVSTRSHRYRATQSPRHARATLEKSPLDSHPWKRLRVVIKVFLGCTYKPILANCTPFRLPRLLPTTYPNIFHRFRLQSRLLRSRLLHILLCMFCDSNGLYLIIK